MTNKRTTKSNITGTMLRNHLTAFLVPEEFSSQRTITDKLDTMTQNCLKLHPVMFIYHSELKDTEIKT